MHVYLFNRYPAFHRAVAKAVCCMLYGEEYVYFAKLVPPCGNLGGTLMSLEHTLGLSWAMSGSLLGHLERS